MPVLMRYCLQNGWWYRYRRSKFCLFRLDGSLKIYGKITIYKGYWFHIHVYCKRGYFRWGEILQKCCHWQDISCGGNFHDTISISFIKAYEFYFHMGGIFVKKTKVQKTWKLLPHEHFLVYSSTSRILIFNLFTVNDYPRGDAGGLSREYVLRIPSVS